MATSINTIRALNAKNSPLLSKLPGEMRNNIYRFAVLDPNIEVDFKTIYSKTALLRVSSQIREEASAVFYLDSQFVITDAVSQLGDIAKLLACMGADNTVRVTSVELHSRLPEDVSKGLKMLYQNCMAGMTPNESAKATAKAIGLPDGCTFELLLDNIYDKAVSPTKKIATTLVRAGVPFMALSGSYTPGGSGRLGRPVTLVEKSEDGVKVGMCEAYMETAIAEHNIMLGSDSGGVQWLGSGYNMWDPFVSGGEDDKGGDEEDEEGDGD